MNSPPGALPAILRYPGGKAGKLGRAIYARTPFAREPGARSRIVHLEPFCGSCGLALLAQPQFALLNDVWGDLLNFWIVLQNDGAAFEELYALALAHAGLAGELDRAVLIGYSRAVQRAVGFVVKNKLSFSGMHAKPTGLTYTKGGLRKSLVRWIRMLHDRNWTFSESDFSDFIEKCAAAAWKKEKFMYVDPPYRAVRGLYEHDFSDGDHERLALALEGADRAGVKWLLSYDDDEWVRHRYAAFDCEELSATYSVSARAVASRELLISNAPPPRAQQATLDPFL